MYRSVIDTKFITKKNITDLEIHHKELISEKLGADETLLPLENVQIILENYK